MKAMRLFDSFLRIMGVLFCIGLLIFGIAWCWPYGEALIWHLRHGSTAQVGEFQVQVPRWVRPDSEAPLRFNFRHGRYDFIELKLERIDTPGDKWKTAWEANSKSASPIIAEAAKRFLALKTTRLMIADQPSFCIEEDLTIHCIPEHQERGLSVYFVGSRNMRPVFYETLGRIKRTAPK